MAATDISPTLEYLTDAAHLLRTAAPESAAHLMSTRHHVMYQHQLAVSEIQRQHVCLACGHIMIPGRESACQLESNASRRPAKGTQIQRAKRQSRSQAFSTLNKTISCDRCKRTTNIAIDPPGPPARQKKRHDRAKMTKVNSQMSNPSQEKEARIAEASKPSANASSKKRAKNRKAGLQALLAGQEQKKSSPLSLSDFMQKK